MPRRAKSGTIPSWIELYDLASSTDGYFTTKDAAKIGYSLPLLQYHLREGRLERARRGIFRLVQYPPSEREDWTVLYLWSNREGVISHKSALMAQNISDALPARTHLTVPTTWAKRRIRVRKGLVLHFADLAENETKWFSTIRITTPLRTIIDLIRDHGAPDIIEQAIHQVRHRGLVSGKDLDRALAGTAFAKGWWDPPSVGDQLRPKTAARRPKR